MAREEPATAIGSRGLRIVATSMSGNSVPCSRALRRASMEVWALTLRSARS